MSYDQPTTLNEDCHHKRATHFHGTNVCARLDRCRCPDCQAARKRYDQAWRRTQGEFPYDPPTMVDAAPVRAHIRQLADAGMGPKRVAQVSGVAHGILAKLVYGDKKRGVGPSRRVARTTAERLLAVTLDVADGAKVPAIEANLIVQELLARGWTKAAIGKVVHGPHAYSLQVGRGPTVLAGTLRTLRTLLDEPVPKRQHPRGHFYQPNPDYEWDEPEPSTPGVPPVERDFPAWLRQLDRERLFAAFAAAGGRI